VTRPLWFISAVAVVFAAAAVIAPAAPAASDAVTVPFVDRLECGTSDAAVTPVFGFAGVGTAMDGLSYTPVADASAYPDIAGSFSGVSAGSAYTMYTPNGYGSDTEYRGSGALGFPNATAASGLTLTIDLPHAQAVEFTVGGIQAPSVIDVSGSANGTAVTPVTAARSSAPGSTAAAVIDGAAHVVGGPATPGVDEVPERAADVWFSSPVDQLMFRLSGSGAGAEGGFLVTPPVACQSGSVAMTSSGVGDPTIDAATGQVSYQVPLVIEVINTTPPSGAALYPAVTSQLSQAFQSQGITLDGLTQTSASSATCALASGANGSGPLISTSAALIPGESCTLDVVASVSMPQSTSDRTVSITGTLASSATAAARLKATSAALPLIFPGLESGLGVSESGATSVLTGRTASHTTTVTNAGQGTALDTEVTIDYPAGAALSGYPPSCTLGPTLQCSIGTVAPSAGAAISYSVTAANSLAPGDALAFTTTASSSSQGDAVTGTYRLTIAGSPAPPHPSPPPSAHPSPPSADPSLPSPPSSSPLPAPSPLPPVTPVSPDAHEEAPRAPVPPPVTSPSKVTALPVDLRLNASRIVPGTAATMRGTLGPNASDEEVSVQLNGSVSKGMFYREVIVEPGGICTVTTLAFVCTVVLQPGDSAAVSIRLYADALNAPDIARQQITVSSSLSSQDNALSLSTDVNRTGETDALATAVTAFDMSRFPGAFLPLLALMLFALAATVAEAKSRRDDS
jgi:hypothetical protein